MRGKQNLEIIPPDVPSETPEIGSDGRLLIIGDRTQTPGWAEGRTKFYVDPDRPVRVFVPPTYGSSEPIEVHGMRSTVLVHGGHRDRPVRIDTTGPVFVDLEQGCLALTVTNATNVGIINAPRKLDLQNVKGEVLVSSHAPTEISISGSMARLAVETKTASATVTIQGSAETFEPHFSSKFVVLHTDNFTVNGAPYQTPESNLKDNLDR